LTTVLDMVLAFFLAALGEGEGNGRTRHQTT
jgi:hypothetical protein